jgi:hypothetical protein
MIVVLLQNAWSPMYAGEVWPRRSWLQALAGCRTGVRLEQCLPIPDFGPLWEGVDYWVDNTTPICGDTARSVVKPDVAHVRGVLADKRPSLVLACGRQAQQVMSTMACVHYCRYGGSRLYMPHPAMRLLTNLACEHVRSLVKYHLDNHACVRTSVDYLGHETNIDDLEPATVARGTGPYPQEQSIWQLGPTCELPSRSRKNHPQSKPK